MENTAARAANVQFEEFLGEDLKGNPVVLRRTVPRKFQAKGQTHLGKSTSAELESHPKAKEIVPKLPKPVIGLGSLRFFADVAKIKPNKTS